MEEEQTVHLSAVPGRRGEFRQLAPGNGIQYSNSTRHWPGSHPHCLMVKIKAFHLPHRPAGRCYERKDSLVNSDIPTYVKQEAPRRCFEKMHQLDGSQLHPWQQLQKTLRSEDTKPGHICRHFPETESHPTAKANLELRTFLSQSSVYSSYGSVPLCFAPVTLSAGKKVAPTSLCSSCWEPT